MNAFRHYLFFFALALVAFGPLLVTPFVYDDVVVVQENTLLRSAPGLAKIWQGHVDSAGEMDGVFRPLFLSFLSFLGKLFGFHPGPMRFVSIALHALNAFLLFRLSRRWFGLGASSAWTAAAIFLLHPIQTTSVAMVWKQSDLWVATAALLSLLWIGRSVFLAGALFSAALLMKESALVIPLFWLTAEPLAEKNGRGRRLSLFAFAVGAAALYYKWFLPMVPHSPTGGGNPAGRLEYFATELSLAPVYLKALLWPAALTIDRNVPAAAGIPFWTAAVLGAAVLAAFTGIAFKKSGLCLAFLFAGIWLIPTSSFQPLALFYDETRLYLTVGMLAACAAIAVSRGLNCFSSNPKTVRAVQAIAVVVLAGATLSIGTRWRSEETLWAAAIAADPTSARAHYQLGLSAQKAKALDEAEAEYRRALQYSSGFENARLNLGIVLGQKGDLDGAEEQFRAILPRGRSWAAAGHYHLGLNDFYRKNYKGAFSHFAWVRKLAPETGQADRGEAIVYDALGKKEEASAARKRYREAQERTR